jgi:hypothetical protein
MNALLEKKGMTGQVQMVYVICAAGMVSRNTASQLLAARGV